MDETTDFAAGTSTETHAEEGKRVDLDFEGTLKPWHKSTITTEEVITLGGWDASQGAIFVDPENNEHTLRPGETMEIRPGSFSKKVRFKRG
jgi:hypothetical protein